MTPGASPARAVVPGEEELGQQKRCPSCATFWPIDDDFYRLRPNGQPLSWCRACVAEVKRNSPSTLARRRQAA
jgi:hypothetical protein